MDNLMTEINRHGIKMYELLDDQKTKIMELKKIINEMKIELCVEEDEIEQRRR